MRPGILTAGNRIVEVWNMKSEYIIYDSTSIHYILYTVEIVVYVYIVYWQPTNQPNIPTVIC